MDLLQTLSFSEKIKNINLSFNIRKFDDIMVLQKSFIQLYNKEKCKLPYHINIIDLLGANENAHSRILGHLLKQINRGRYEVLESFLSYIKAINPSYKLNVESPKISIEKWRIDILIRDREYAIIIENKVHNAIDQSEQLKRYIEITSGMGYSKEQIYVLYLPRDESKFPCDESWGNYKDSFQKRYEKITFRENILPWLKGRFLPEVRLKDIYLKSSIEQYIDHLEGLFSSREIQTNMNKELKKHISEAIGLGDVPGKNHRILSEKIEDLNKVQDQLSQIKDQTEKECWEEWDKWLKSDFPSLEILNEINEKIHPKVGVKIHYKGKHFCILIEKETNIYFGIGRHTFSEILDEDIREMLKPLLDGFKEECAWYGWKYTSFENAYKRLKSLIEDVIKLTKNDF